MFKQILIAVALTCAAGAFAAVDVNQAKRGRTRRHQGHRPCDVVPHPGRTQEGPVQGLERPDDGVKGVGQASAARLSSEGLTVGGATFRIAVPATDAKPAAGQPKN